MIRLPLILSLLIWFLVIVGLLVILRVVHAQPPAGSPDEFAPWFQSLRVPSGSHKNESCCSIADCRTVDYKSDATGYIVHIPSDINANMGDLWLPVPPDKILQRIDNPTGRGVVCFTPARGIMCFVRTAEG